MPAKNFLSFLETTKKQYIVTFFAYICNFDIFKLNP